MATGTDATEGARRQANLQAILKWSLKQTDGGVADVRRMDDEVWARTIEVLSSSVVNSRVLPEEKEVVARSLDLAVVATLRDRSAQSCRRGCQSSRAEDSVRGTVSMVTGTHPLTEDFGVLAFVES